MGQKGSLEKTVNSVTTKTQHIKPFGVQLKQH